MTSTANVVDTDVLIIGAGPVGLMLANLLGTYGCRAIVLESRDELIDFPRAVGLDDESFRLIQTVGLGEQIEPITGPSHIMRLVNAKGRVILYNDPQIAPFGWPRKNAFSQPDLDRHLLNGLNRFPHVQVHFGHSVDDAREDFDGITATAAVTLPDGGPQSREFRARYLVGCEGGKSPTRKRMGVTFDGLSPSTRWLVVDVANDPLGTPNVWLGADPKRPYVSIGLPQAVRRFEFRLNDDEPDDVVLQPAWVENALRDHVPDPTSLEFIRWRVYTHHGRVAGSFRVGRQLIAGDAAHLMPVWLGQGWNSGVRDAMNLGWKLASVVNGSSSDELLDTYTAERMDHVTSMVKLSMRMGSVIKLDHPVGVFARDTAARVVNNVPWARRYFGEMKFRPLPRYTTGVVVDQSTLTPGTSSPRITARSIPFIQAVNSTSPVGTQFPQPRVTTTSATNVRLDDVTGTWWSALFWQNDPYRLLDANTIAKLQHLRARLITVVPENQRPEAEQRIHPDVTVVGDHTGALKSWWDSRPLGVVLLRPDHFIAGVALAQQTPTLIEAALTAACIHPLTHSVSEPNTTAHEARGSHD